MRTIILLAIGILSFAKLAQGDERGSVIVMELKAGHVIYEADGKSSDLDGLIPVLRTRASKTHVGPYNDVAIILASQQLTVANILGLYSTLQAYGFREIRLFVFTPDKTRLLDLSLGSKVVPFTKDRTELLDLLQGQAGSGQTGNR